MVLGYLILYPVQHPRSRVQGYVLMRIRDVDPTCGRLMAVQFGSSIIQKTWTRVLSDIHDSRIWTPSGFSVIVLISHCRCFAMSGLVPYAKIKPNKGKITAFGLTMIQLFWLVWLMLGEL